MNLCRKQSAGFMIFFSSAHLLVCMLRKANTWVDAEQVFCQKDVMAKQFCNFQRRIKIGVGMLFVKNNRTFYFFLIKFNSTLHLHLAQRQKEIF